MGRRARQSQDNVTVEPPASKKKKPSINAHGSNESPPNRAFYLMKSEPETFSIDQLADKENQTECWDGVRNAQARNIMKGMNVGDQAFFYHSSCKVPGICGIVEVVRTSYPDHTQFDPSSDYYDRRSTEEAPRWFMVDIQLKRRLKRHISLEELRTYHDTELKGMVLLNRSRLSVQPVSPPQWDFILSLEDRPDPTRPDNPNS